MHPEFFGGFRKCSEAFWNFLDCPKWLFPWGGQHRLFRGMLFFGGAPIGGQLTFGGHMFGWGVPLGGLPPKWWRHVGRGAHLGAAPLGSGMVGGGPLGASCPFWWGDVGKGGAFLGSQLLTPLPFPSTINRREEELSKPSQSFTNNGMQ